MLVDFTVNRDRGLIERLRKGDRNALADIYRAHHPAVHRFALYLTADPQAAIEITQDVFVWLMDHAERFDAERGSLGSFLGGIARKFAARRRVADRRFELLHRPVEPGLVAEPTAGDGSGERHDRVPELRRAVAALPALYREAIAICDLQGKSYEETAALLGCPVGTVRSRLHRARSLLARKLGAGSPAAGREGATCKEIAMKSASV